VAVFATRGPSRYFGGDGTSYAGLNYSHGFSREEVRSIQDLATFNSDTVRAEFDVLLGSRAVSPLASGAVSAGTTSVTLPAGLAAGHYYIFAMADAPGTTSEAVETNNTILVSIDVTVP